jgi:hypothetical protein
MSTLKVVNRYSHKGPQSNEIDIYIGRGTPWGNPFRKDKLNLDKDEAIECYKQHIYTNLKSKDTKLYNQFLELKELILKGYNVNLVCSCKPKNCHGDVIKTIIDRWVSKENKYEIKH